MRAYRVSTEIPPAKGAEVQVSTTKVQYAGTNAEARQARETMVNDYNVRKKDVIIEEVDIPTAKSELLGFINDLINPTT